MRIGIYGGSFDPIHTGHAMLANFISQSGLVDEVWLMVSKVNPLKTLTPPASDEHRIRMAEIVAEDCENVRVSDFELGLPSPSYTYLTLCELSRCYPEHSFRIIIGSDNWLEFERWRDPEAIIRRFGVIIYPRPGYEIEGELPEGVDLIEGVPTVELSSTFVRENVKEGRNINYFVPVAVGEYIRRHGLYKN